MKAVICPKYSPPKVFKLTEIDTPHPNDDEILIRNYGSSINTVDVAFRKGGAPKEFFWLFKPLMRLTIRCTAGGLIR
jgi:NADPH:quinone reductase-like Zn-dependent oxidoreductase